MDEIQYKHLFEDGTKIETNANKYSFVWKKSTTKYETRLLKKRDETVPILSEKYDSVVQDPKTLLGELESRMTGSYVHGRGRGKTELQRDIEQLRELLQRKEKYEGYQETFKGRNSFSKTDPEATFMHMKEDHTRNAQLKPGYNIPFGTEGEYITGVSVSAERSDQLTLIPFMENLKKNGIEYRDVTADAGYESEENYAYFERTDSECYINRRIMSEARQRNSRATWRCGKTWGMTRS